MYRITFLNKGEVYEVYARSVGQGSLYGFLEVSEMVFGERTTVVVDPAEERIQSEFEGVTSTFIPMHHVLRVDAVERQGKTRISSADGDNVTPFPASLYPTKPAE